MRKIILVVSFLVLALSLYYFVKTTLPKKKTILGGDRDAHGCIGSAGYSWCDEKQKCLREWEEPCK